MPDEELELIPPNNLICKRNLSTFSVLAERSAKCSNRHFKEKCVRDDITLFRSFQVTTVSRKIQSMLDERESWWYEGQKAVSNIERLIQNRKIFEILSTKFF